MKIRKAGLKDVPAIVKMWNEFRAEHDKNVVDINPRLKDHVEKKKASEKLFRDHVIRSIKSKNSVVFIAEDEGKPTGYNISHVRANIPVFKIEKLGHIGDMFVRKEYRGAKVSSMLKDNAFDWFRKKGLEYASIEVAEPNSHAHSVYEKWGFVAHRIEMRKKLGKG